MKIKTKLAKTPGYNSHYVPIPFEEGEEALAKFGKRIIWRVNDGNTIHSALQRSKSLGHFIMVGKGTLAKLNIESEAEIEVYIQKDDTPYQSPMPEELQATLETDPESEVIFQTLSPGFQRSIIHYVDSAKRVDTRIERALKVLGRLKDGIRDRKEIFR